MTKKGRRAREKRKNLRKNLKIKRSNEKKKKK